VKPLRRVSRREGGKGRRREEERGEGGEVVTNEALAKLLEG
jgi:hypothetical protein